ncbi:arginine-hydroxylase NDUFAF5, mitochondrial-like [Amphibalanus amphitrite]|nr:arginine-hydroxylase NDUFAF5, mitochondrial-like [Amphibalanus amphitrite]XP_043232910.1 arginine-hydroxylase NDUFAF5, mitochondrial-like [Amphibalanus amphitrite]XP_043232911.1 arginine-hydroxylase NDUFAF5, mitochondrial-like [Amphibalanus amphitrite]
MILKPGMSCVARFTANQFQNTECWRTISTSTRACFPAIIFDRKAKEHHRNTAGQRLDSSLYDYVKEEVGWRVADRVFDIKRQFGTVLDLGCGKGYVLKHFDKDMVKKVVACEMSSSLLAAAQCLEDVSLQKINFDEEELQLEDSSVDLVTSSLSLHWVNDLPGCFGRVLACLRPDSAFVGAMLGGDTLYQLRCALQLASLERDGGIGVHVSPFVKPQDVVGLLTRAGFTMLTIDVDAITVGYPSMFELMWDLQGMAENNAAVNRTLRLNRDTMLAAAAIYQEMYGSVDEQSGEVSVPATFEVLHFIAWKPGASQPRPLERGSGTVSLKDLGSVIGGAN